MVKFLRRLLNVPIIEIRWRGSACIGDTDCVFRRQKPTLAMASEMAASSAWRTASTLRLPPTASRSFVTAASVTSSFVCDDNMRDTSVANLRFCDDVTNKMIVHRSKQYRVERTLGSVSLNCALSHPMVSTGATIDSLICLILS